jgi:hypothetical protein
MLFTNPLYKKIAILTPVPTYTSESPISEFVIPSVKITLYNGIIIELKGINIEKTNKDNKNVESLVFVRHSFQPAMLERKIIKKADKLDMKIVLKSVCR